MELQALSRYRSPSAKEKGLPSFKKLIYLDYDGVLHDDDVYFHPKRGIYLDAPNRQLFEWMPILETLLVPHPDVGIVLSTSWVRVKSFSYAKERLSLVLQEKVVGATFHSREMRKSTFDDMSRGAQVVQDVSRRQPLSWLAIDNDDEDWPATHSDKLVLTQDRTGLSDPKVQIALAKALFRL